MGIDKRHRNRGSMLSSPTSDNDSENIKKRPYNYLQRIHSSKSQKQPTFVYIQAEFLRLSVDLIHKFSFKDQLKEYLRLLDSGESISLSDINNPNIRKKMRHLLRALYVEEKNGLYTKSPDCDISLRHLLTEFKEYIEDKCKNLPKPKSHYEYNNINEINHRNRNSSEFYEKNLTRNDSTNEQTSNEQTSNEQTIDLKTSLKSLRELHEEGFYVDYKQMQEEFMRKHKMSDLWGLSASEQLHVLNNSDQDESYVTGNAVKSVLSETVSQLDRNAYKDLIAAGKEFRANFA